MLIIRATSSLTKKIKASVSSTINHEVSFISEWYAKDFRFERANLVLFVNAKTFLPVVVKAASYHDVSLRFTGELGRVLVACGFNYPLGNLSAEVIYGKPIVRCFESLRPRYWVWAIPWRAFWQWCSGTVFEVGKWPGWFRSLGFTCWDVCQRNWCSST